MFGVRRLILAVLTLASLPVGTNVMDTPPTPAEVVYEQRVTGMLKDNEGLSQSMYCDACEPPVVTVGNGHALFTVQSAQALPFVHASDSTPASSAEIAAEYYRTKALRIGPGSKSANLILSLDTVRSVGVQDVQKAVVTLRKEVPNYDELPDNARLALLDIAFNCGSLKGFPHLVAAVETKDWKAAAQRSHRMPPVSEARNKFVRDLFMGLVDQEGQV